MAKLLLLQKGNKSLEDPSLFRPICLLDIEGKLFEQLLLARLKSELTRTGDLSPNQFGFRKGKQTVNAINKLLKIAKEAENFAHANRILCVVITLDVKNAFNSASWQIILDELKTRRINESLIRVISSYLSNRYIILCDGSNSKALQINSGVPQGSVFGPLCGTSCMMTYCELKCPTEPLWWDSLMI